MKHGYGRGCGLISPGGPGMEGEKSDQNTEPKKEKSENLGLSRFMEGDVGESLGKSGEIELGGIDHDVEGNQSTKRNESPEGKVDRDFQGNAPPVASTP